MTAAEKHYAARLRVSDAKMVMDFAQQKLDEAEAEWDAALRELDRLDGIELPTFHDVRGILKE